MAKTQLCSFFVEDRLLGIDVADVQEIVRDQQETPVPLAPEAVRALINLRGQVVTVVDLRRCLGMPPYAGAEKPVYIVLRCDGELLSLHVDRMQGVVEVSEEQFERPTELDEYVRKALVRGVYKQDAGLLMALDVRQVLELVR